MTLNSVCMLGVHGANLLRIWLSPAHAVLLFVDDCLHHCPGSGYHPGLWPGSKISYHNAIRIPTLALVCVM